MSKQELESRRRERDTGMPESARGRCSEAFAGDTGRSGLRGETGDGEGREGFWEAGAWPGASCSVCRVQECACVCTPVCTHTCFASRSACSAVTGPPPSQNLHCGQATVLSVRKPWQHRWDRTEAQHLCFSAALFPVCGGSMGIAEGEMEQAQDKYYAVLSEKLPTAASVRHPATSHSPPGPQVTAELTFRTGHPGPGATALEIYCQGSA